MTKEIAMIEVRKTMDKFGIDYMPKLAQISSLKVRGFVRYYGGGRLAKEIGVHEMAERICRYCEKPFRNEYGDYRRVYCSDVCRKEAINQRQRNNYKPRVKTTSSHEPKPVEEGPESGECGECAFSYDTDLMIIVDLLKGWPHEKVAEINAKVYQREYEHVLERIKYLKNSLHGKRIFNIVNSYREAQKTLGLVQ